MRVLILCTGNSARSQMAESILRHLSKGAIDVHSAGTVPQSEIHPMARAAVKQLFDIDMIGQHPKAVDGFLGRPFDYVVTVCDHAAETCPVFPGGVERIHWRYEDPASAIGTAAERQQAFNAVAQDLARRIRLWLALPAIRSHIQS